MREDREEHKACNEVEGEACEKMEDESSEEAEDDEASKENEACNKTKLRGSGQGSSLLEDLPG